MSLVRYEPVNLFDQFNHEINRFLNAANTPAEDASNARGWIPSVDIREEDDRFLLHADIPGVKREDIEITLEDGVLTVQGERTSVQDKSSEGFHRRERVYGSFTRQFTLPDTVNTENISATVNDGVLEIGIPKQAKPAAKKIAVS